MIRKEKFYETPSTQKRTKFIRKMSDKLVMPEEKGGKRLQSNNNSEQ